MSRHFKRGYVYFELTQSVATSFHEIGAMELSAKSLKYIYNNYTICLVISVEKLLGLLMVKNGQLSTKLWVLSWLLPSFCIGSGIPWKPQCTQAWLMTSSFEAFTKVAYGGHHCIRGRLTWYKQILTPHIAFMLIHSVVVMVNDNFLILPTLTCVTTFPERKCLKLP